MKRLALAALALFVLASTASAMDLPPGKWWRRPEVIQMLSLSDDQQNRLETISVKSANELIDLKGEVEKSNIALRAELDQPTLNREAIRKLAIRLNDARGHLFERELMMLVDMRAVLSETQWNRMRQTLERLPERQQIQRPNARRRMQ
jgi:hypothetical protein